MKILEKYLIHALLMLLEVILKGRKLSLFTKDMNLPLRMLNESGLLIPGDIISNNNNKTNKGKILMQEF